MDDNDFASRSEIYREREREGGGGGGWSEGVREG